MKKTLFVLCFVCFFVVTAAAQKPAEPKEDKFEDIRAFMKAQGDMMENFIKNSTGADTPKKAAAAINMMVDDMEKTIPLIKEVLKNRRDFNGIMSDPPEKANPEKKRIQNLSSDMADAFDRMLKFKENGYVKEALERLKQFQIDTRKMIRDGSKPE